MTEIQIVWGRVHTRVRALVEAGHVYLAAQRIQSEDPHGVAYGLFRDQARQILEEIVEFRARFAAVAPAATLTSIDRFLSPEGLARLIRADGISGLDIIKTSLPILTAISAEVDFSLADSEELGSRVTERAFGHLQRTIAIIPEVAANWQKAFQNGEVPCEQLGGLHLLQFGVFAFKVNAGGARTDLMYSDPVSPTDPLVAGSTALVLTEWKIVRAAGTSKETARKAQVQLEAYSLGPLLGVELRRHRYVVLVSESQLDPIQDVTRGEVVYRHLNIAVKPKVPSRV